MAREVQKYMYLYFVVNGCVYLSMCLPVVLTNFGCEFTKLLLPVVQLLWLQGVKLHMYLDDWLTWALSSAQAKLHADLSHVLQNLSWVINFSQSKCRGPFKWQASWDMVPAERVQVRTVLHQVAWWVLPTAGVSLSAIEMEPGGGTTLKNFDGGVLPWFSWPYPWLQRLNVKIVPLPSENGSKSNPLQ